MYNYWITQDVPNINHLKKIVIERILHKEGDLQSTDVSNNSNVIIIVCFKKSKIGNTLVKSVIIVTKNSIK